jgi:hypothetical protein
MASLRGTPPLVWGGLMLAIKVDSLIGVIAFIVWIIRRTDQ